MKPEFAIDLDVLDLDARQASALNRRALLWLVGMLALVGMAIVLLTLFLRDVEAQEEDRRRAADAEWLDQTLRFHFLRLEADLGVFAVPQLEQTVAEPLRAGMLWRGQGVIEYHGWIPAEQQVLVEQWPPFLRAAVRSPEVAGALAIMLDTGRGLQRAAYAGPLTPSDGTTAHTLWLAVPFFEQGRFLGSSVAAVQVERALEQVVPAWFLQEHGVGVVSDPGEAEPPVARRTGSYFAPINLPGAQLKLQVTVLDTRPAAAPRAFFGLALLFLVGMFVALYFLWRDVERRRRVESQLQTQMALRMAMERSVTLGLRAWNLDGRLLYANQAFCRMVGWSARELVADPGAPPYWPVEQGDEFQAMTQPALAPAEQQLGCELQLLHRDGSRLDVLVHGAPLTLANGGVIGWMGSALDITQRKRVERLAARQQEKLEASGRLVAIGEVASTLAHELNQPLGALSSFANGLLNRLREGRITLAEIELVVERMTRMAEKAGRVIHRVNAFARRQEMTLQPLELCAFIRRVAGHVPLPEGLTLQMRLPDSGPSVQADALLLEHALHNVLLNATEWAGHGAHEAAAIRVGLVTDEAMAGIRIEDSGPGVPPEQRSAIFDAFASQRAGGMGMGLSICRSIIEAHRGRIEVDRSAELSGAQFTLWLPLNL